MIVNHAYVNAMKAIEAAYGPVGEYGCIRCVRAASRWVVDNRAPATVSVDMRRFSGNPDDVWPMCTRCEHDYDLMDDAAGPVFRRVSTFAQRHWFADCFAVDAEGSVSLRDAYTTYLDHCAESQIPTSEIMTRHAFKAAMLRHGGIAARSRTGVLIRKIRLRTN
ncbi:hypothetical protein [Streptomyces sp. NPDC005795]|uniref:hypothetical protein n=1 Tax=Streptomyces sp. NPDC005795 TaxID=3154677 RepID=UPI0033D025C6